MDILNEILDNQHKNRRPTNLDEMASVAAQTNEAPTFCIYVNPDNHRIGNEYFKVYDKPSYFSSKKVCRISFHAPKYLIHRNRDGKKNFVLDAQRKKDLIKKLSEQHEVTIDGQAITVWQWAIMQYNKELGLPYKESLENISYDESGNEINRSSWKHPDYMPIDLPMPDYNKLPDKLKTK